MKLLITKKSKLAFAITGVCLSLLLVIPLYAGFGDEVIIYERCPAVDKDGYTVLLPNPDDCGSFFMCSNGVPILQNCPEGLHFNVRLNVCDWPQNACCEPCLPEQE